MARRVANNIYEVERTEGWWLWKRTYVLQAYWYEDANGMFGGWYWVDTDRPILDPDVRIELCEADNQWKREQEEQLWKKQKKESEDVWKSK